MEVPDKYAVLEFLVKELMGMRKEDQKRRQPELFNTANVHYDVDDRGFSPTSERFQRERANTFDRGASPAMQKKRLQQM